MSGAQKFRWFVKGDFDGFFGLFVDNLLQIMLIVALCGAVCGFPPELIAGRILPGAAVSILAGNLFYAWQAARLARREGRADVTALPYGVNTPSLVAYIFAVMGPVYQATGDAELAWRIGLFACLGSGVIETAGAFAGAWLRRHTPRAALLCALAGVALTFISMGFVMQIFASPVIALAPAFLILAAYGGRARFPLGLPGGLVAIGIGTLTAWVMKWAGFPSFSPPAPGPGAAWHPPLPALGELGALFSDPRAWGFLAVIVPMGVLNVIGSLQNLESAEAAGDRFSTRSSLLANGLGTIAAACFGSAFPTTIYIGHPGWKAMGARAGYSVLNGVVITALCLTGGALAVLRVVPIEAALGILVWIGIIITAQAFQETPRPHALAVAAGLLPSLGAWAFLLVDTTARAAGVPLAELAPRFGGDLFIKGVFALNQGFLVTSTLLAGMMVFVVERRFEKAALWAGLAAVCSATGLIHAWTLDERGLQPKFGLLAAPEFAAAYGAVALLFLWLFVLNRTGNGGARLTGESDREEKPPQRA